MEEEKKSREVGHSVEGVGRREWGPRAPGRINSNPSRSRQGDDAEVEGCGGKNEKLKVGESVEVDREERGAHRELGGQEKLAADPLSLPILDRDSGREGRSDAQGHCVRVHGPLIKMQSKAGRTDQERDAQGGHVQVAPVMTR